MELGFLVKIAVISVVWFLANSFLLVATQGVLISEKADFEKS